MSDDRKLIAYGARLELARRSFFDYCCLKAPDFYRPERAYQKQLCDAMQDFLASDDRVLIINAPPRHGKSRTAGCLVEWALGNNHRFKVMTGSYNETLSTAFSKNVRNTIAEIKVEQYRPVYTDVFPGTAIKYGDGAMNLWSLEDGYSNYLATSPTGTATGFGADLIIVDDLIKNALEAYNETVKDNHWSWFTNTMLQRLENMGKIIIIMTRWATNDLAGRALEYFEKEGWKLRHISMKAMQDDGSMLCEDILCKEDYLQKTKAMDRAIALANYQQTPIDIKGRLYTSFRTYEDVPRDTSGAPLFTAVKNYTDTADEGSDYLCSVNYGEYMGEAYVLDVLFTKAPMEQTEPATAKMLIKDRVNWADIESNNGGRGFARNVEREMALQGWNRTHIAWFHQSKNKNARILTNATFVMNHIYFPVNWMDRWPEFYESMARYQREGRNAHDDAQDAITGVAEKVGMGRPKLKTYSGGI